MGAARGMFDEAKHHRGFHGRFGSGGRSYSARNVGRKGMSRMEMQDLGRSPKSTFTGHNIASATTMAFASRKSGRKRAVVKFGPALYTDEKTGTHTVVTGRFGYSTKTAAFTRSLGWRPKRKG